MVRPGPDPDRGVYGITTAADLVGLGVQTLRLYEARGLLEPDRTAGGTRRYSAHDLDRLRQIAGLLATGSTSPASPWSSTWRTRMHNCATTRSSKRAAVGRMAAG
jgi:hypothetical protein